MNLSGLPAKIDREAILKFLPERPQICLLGIRGYFSEELNENGENEFGVYDDAIILIVPDSANCFNGNCDPSNYEGETADLDTGKWYFKLGIHGLDRLAPQRYEALVQERPVTVRRANGKIESGFFGINIHRGGIFSTGSLGCQTIYAPQWPFFISAVKQAMADQRQNYISYFLVDRR